MNHSQTQYQVLWTSLEMSSFKTKPNLSAVAMGSNERGGGHVHILSYSMEGIFKKSTIYHAFIIQ